MYTGYCQNAFIPLLSEEEYQIPEQSDYPGIISEEL
jgi:hypothetical protein